MSIDTLQLRGRKQVAWLRAKPPDDARRALEEREFVVTTCTDEELRDGVYLAGLATVVFAQDPTKLYQVSRDLQAHSKRLLDYDCRIVVRPAETDKSSGTPLVAKVVAKLRLPTAGLNGDETILPPLPHVQVYQSGVPWSVIANFIADHRPGKAPNQSLRIQASAPLQPDCDLLLRRAFADCAEIHLVPLDGGRSGASVYRAYAELAGGELGRWPLPYFVKFGNREKIFAEYENYRARVDPYVPFHLGPHLIDTRCCLGADKGIIVGDYVDESESLRDCARDGRGAQAIACLFDRTLHGWYRDATKEPTAIAKLLSFPRSLPSARFAMAQKLGATRHLTELRQLFNRCHSQPTMWGPVHGDLHAANVRVRATDAIVIDFLSHRQAPLVYDAACLEASLLVDGFSDEDTADFETTRNWMNSLSTLYTSTPLDLAPSHTNPKYRCSWFYLCVRQVRLYARRMECGTDQYAAALAVALIQKACKDPRAPEPEALRRAAAFVFAEAVLDSTFGSKQSRSPNP